MFTLSLPQIAWRVARDIPDGSMVKLGAGAPALVRDHVARDQRVMFTPDSAMTDPASAPALSTARLSGLSPGASADILIVTADQVSEQGAFAIQHCPVQKHQDIPASGVQQVFVMMELFTKDGHCKLLPGCSLPLTGAGVSSIYTDLAVFDIQQGQLTLREIVEGITLPVLQAEMEAEFFVSPRLQLLQAPKPVLPGPAC